MMEAIGEKQRLIDIVREIDALMDGMVNEAGEIEMPQEMEDLAYAMVDKVEGCVFALRLHEGNVNAFKEWKADTEARIKSEERKVEWLKNYLSMCLKYEPFESAKARITFRNTQRVEVPNVEALPTEYIRETVKREADKRAIGEAFKRGENVPGAELIQEKKIQIK